MPMLDYSNKPYITRASVKGIIGNRKVEGVDFGYDIWLKHVLPFWS